MQDYGRLREQILSLPINGCVTGLRVERGALQGFIWEHNFNKNHIWLSAAAPANSSEIFSDDRICLEARVTDFACESKVGVANPGSLPVEIYRLIFLRRLVAPIDADAARSAFPIQSVTYGLNLTCSINVEASSVSVRGRVP